MIVLQKKRFLPQIKKELNVKNYVSQKLILYIYILNESYLNNHCKNNYENNDL